MKLSRKFIGPIVLLVGLVIFKIVYTYSDPLHIFQVWNTGSPMEPGGIVVCFGTCQFMALFLLVAWILSLFLILAGAIISIELLFPREEV